MLCENLYNTYNEIRHCLRSDQKMTNKQMSKTSGQLLPCERRPLSSAIYLAQKSRFKELNLPLTRTSRLQNSPYFYVFKYARAVKQKVWYETENRERDWGELARVAHARLLRHALPISLLILRKKPTVLQSIELPPLTLRFCLSRDVTSQVWNNR